jgi:hypothetical protein
MIEGGSGFMENNGKKFTITPQTAYTTEIECDADGYPEEKRF